MRLPEIELREVTVQVLLFAVLIGADHPALENADVAFGAVRVDLMLAAFAAVLLVVVHAFMVSHNKVRLVELRAISVQRA